MSMNEYSVSGRWEARDGWQSFEKTIEAENEDVAREHVYAEFGSKHGLKRRGIEISETQSAGSGSADGGEGVDT